jgi:hypothetical protein
MARCWWLRGSPRGFRTTKRRELRFSALLPLKGEQSLRLEMVVAGQGCRLQWFAMILTHLDPRRMFLLVKVSPSVNFS